MLVIYDAQSGAIKYTIEGELELDGVTLQDNEAALVTLVEHGGQITTLRVDTSGGRPQLVPKWGVRLECEQTVVAGKPLRVRIRKDEGIGCETIPLQVNNETVPVPTSSDAIDLEFTLPGEYRLWVADYRFYCPPVIVSVSEGVAS